MGSHVEVYRCAACGKLIEWGRIKKQGCCPCGSLFIRDGFPSNLYERILVWYWNNLKYRSL